MTWILIALGILIGGAALVVVVGMLLPRDHVAQTSIALRAEPDRVWSLISDVGGTGRWRPDVRAVEMREPVDGRVRFIERTRTGPMPFEVVSQEPPTKQVIRVVDDGLAFGGTWTWELAAEESGTRLTISEAGFIRNPIFRVMSRLFFPPTATMEGYLQALAEQLGEQAEPVVVRTR